MKALLSAAVQLALASDTWAQRGEVAKLVDEVLIISDLRRRLLQLLKRFPVTLR